MSGETIILIIYLPLTYPCATNNIFACQVKREHYRALAHYYVAVGLIDHLGALHQRTKDTLMFLHDNKVGQQILAMTSKLFF